MISGILMNFVGKLYPNVSEFLEENESETDTISLNIQTNQQGKLIVRNQITDYWYCDDELSNMNFYDFVRCT